MTDDKRYSTFAQDGMVGVSEYEGDPGVYSRRTIWQGTPREFAELVSQVRDLTGERERERQALGNLLAVIHRDGGHYQAEHGSKKAAEDAETLVCWLRDNVERLESQVRELTQSLAKALADIILIKASRAELRAAVEKLTAKVTDYENRTGEAKGI